MEITTTRCEGRPIIGHSSCILNSTSVIIANSLTLIFTNFEWHGLVLLTTENNENIQTLLLILNQSFSPGELINEGFLNQLFDLLFCRDRSYNFISVCLSVHLSICLSFLPSFISLFVHQLRVFLRIDSVVFSKFLL